jgi:HK97 family phage portal protein
VGLFSRKKKPVEEQRDALSDLLGSNLDPSVITKEQAMGIPSVASCVNLISDTVASLPIKLYKVDENGDNLEVKNDPRVSLLNVDTGDTLNPYMMKKAMIEDMLMYGAGYTYINKQRNSVQSLNYVDNRQVGVNLLDPNPIFKKLEFVIYGQNYHEWEFVKVTRKTKDGIQGTGVIQENNKLLSVAYNQLCFEDMMYRTGGNKKGFLKAANKLSEVAMNALKTAFSNLYSNNSENVIILNNGLEFQEANNSAVEMQVNQNKIANDEAIYKMFNVPIELLNGKATGGNELLFDSFVKLAILPVLKAYETSLNRDLLLTKEKGTYEFRFDTNEIQRADILKRFQAYDFAVKNGILQIDEIRSKEGYKPLELDFIKLGLQDVLYLPDKKQIYTPNTNRLTGLGEKTDLQGDEAETPQPSAPSDKEVKTSEDESGNPGQ